MNALRLSSRILARSPTIGRAASVPLSGRRWVSSSDSITYSGGQPTVGQGGYYGAGGARAEIREDIGGGDERSRVLAMAKDVETVSSAMDEYMTLERLLENEGTEVNNKSIELKAAMKKLMTSPEFVAALNRLEVQGEPVWGLSTEEREMIFMAREKMNSS